MNRVLVTGATGMIGRETCRRYVEGGAYVRAAVRRGAPSGVASQTVNVGDIHGGTSWGVALDGIDIVVHIAGYAHSVDSVSADECRRVNAEGSAALVEAAKTMGVKRFVLLSSAKVHGGSTSDSAAFTERDIADPRDPYAKSKWEAEQSVMTASTAFSYGCTVLRSPLVYGPGVRANFLALMRAVDRGVPLPVGMVKNRRSMIYSGNLADALYHAGTNRAAAGQLFLVSDGEPVSTPRLIRSLASALGREARIIPIPGTLLKAALRLAGRHDVAERLLGSFVVDDSHFRRTLSWTPPFSFSDGMALTAMWYRNTVTRTAKAGIQVEEGR